MSERDKDRDRERVCVCKRGRVRFEAHHNVALRKVLVPFTFCIACFLFCTQNMMRVYLSLCLSLSVFLSRVGRYHNVALRKVLVPLKHQPQPHALAGSANDVVRSGFRSDYEGWPSLC